MYCHIFFLLYLFIFLIYILSRSPLYPPIKNAIKTKEQNDNVCVCLPLFLHHFLPFIISFYIIFFSPLPSVSTFCQIFLLYLLIFLFYILSRSLLYPPMAFLLFELPGHNVHYFKCSVVLHAVFVSIVNFIMDDG